ncbi:MAG: outer membrane beta-barrel protein [Planctomycetaceae bacterium]
MKLSKMALVAAIACGIHAGSAFGQQANNAVQQVACADCDCGQPVCGCEAPAASCDNGCGAASCDGGCDSSCGLGSCFDGCCDLGDPWTLFDEHCGWTAGGWTQIGYHSANLRNFNNRDSEVQLQQAWLYAQKALDTSCGFDIGGRIDYVYGTDAQDTQVFGTNRGWDSDWDNGGPTGYGHALPQAYVEAGYGDLSVKAGHFFTIIGWEVVPATGNFFYSHAYTMYNSEPFTHTGTLATYNVSDTTTVWGGHVFGWDGGFDDNGDSFLGGISQQISDDVKLIYAAIGGRFSEPQRFSPGTTSTAERGYMHSFVADVAITDKLQYIYQNDILDTEVADGSTGRDVFDINQYLIYSINDCWAIGSRFEWWNVSQDSTLYNGVAGTDGNVDIYALTLGLNYKPNANVIVRPEVRYDWLRDDATLVNNSVAVFEDGDSDQFTFGMDTIFTF